MERLIDYLSGLREQPLGTVIVIGAGDGLTLDRARLEALAPKRLVLADGDPETAAALERRLGALPFVHVRAQALAAQSGPLPWRRYSVAALNGPLDAQTLQTYFPRLRLTEQREVEAVALGAFVKNVAVPEHTNVLVLDVPGQEDTLLGSVPLERLQAFDAIVLRGCREAPPPGGASAELAVQRLQKLAFRLESTDDRTEPLWPLAVLRFDPLRQTVQRMERELGAARERQRQSESRAAELEKSHAQLLAQARDAERRTAEHLQQVQRLTRAAENDQALLAEREARLVDAAAREDELRRALEAQAESGRVSHQTLERRCAEAESQLDAARIRAAELESELRTLEMTQQRHVARQQVLQEELHRAEGQIDLIKGLLLNDHGL